MLITVLVLTGTILGATTIAGLLTLYQLRQATDVVNSTKAVFAADSGLEWRLYKFFKKDSHVCEDCPNGGVCPQPLFDDSNVVFETACISSENQISVKSTGISHDAARAFEMILSK